MNEQLKHNNKEDNITFGPVHLKVTNLKKASLFWTNIAGLKVRYSNDLTIEFGSENKTLVVVHNTADTTYRKGFSGLYHFAIHVPNIAEFASVINRLHLRGFPYSPTDQTMSKAVYFEDFDGVTMEYTLETPEREVKNANGIAPMIKPKPLYVNEVMQSLEDDNINKIIDADSFVGHIHLYANNVAKSNEFYKNIGFTPNRYNSQVGMADLSAGGDFGHRIALNSWHGINRPLAPSNSAGLDYFQLIYKNKEQLKQVLDYVVDYEENEDGYWIKDPTGNKILLRK